jgi:hypothetical protein
MFPKYLLALLIVIFPLSGCSPENGDQGEILSRINEYRLYLDDFQRQLAEEVELDHKFKITREAKEKFLEDIIKKELLIQEAKKYRLDQKEDFIRTIERYWEATLIRNLMTTKGQEIEKLITVSQGEIKDYYLNMKQTRDDLPPLGDMQEELRRIIKEDKKTRQLEDWITELRTRAEVVSNLDLLGK